MRIKNKKSITSAGEHVNEDIFGICQYGAWVLDGSSGLTKVNVTKSDSDTKWFVEQWNDYLYKNINTDMNLDEIIQFGIINIGENFRKIQGKRKLEHIDLPSLSMSVVRFKNHYIEYFVLGDCCILYKESSEVNEIYDDRVSRLDKSVIDKMIYISETKKVSILEARKICAEDLKTNRMLKNSTKGYWIIGFEKEAVSHALTGKITARDGISICITTDGFSQYYDTLNLAENKAEFFYKVQNNKVEDLLLQIRNAQDNDESCDKYPRLKKSDDATLIYLELER